MFALGLGLMWIGYTAGLYGYILIRGYDVSFVEMIAGPWPPTVSASAQFQPGPATLGGPGITGPDQTPPNAGAGPGGSTANPGSGNRGARPVP